MTKALITGGAGFVGSHLAEELLKRGQEVWVIDNLTTGAISNLDGIRDNPKFHYVIDSIENETLLAEMVDRVDDVYHLAAAVGVSLVVNDPVHTIECNIVGTRLVLDACAKKGKRTLITSTSEVYGKNKDQPLKEDADSVFGASTFSRWSYAASKAVDEFLALAYHRQKDLPVTVVRLFNTVGPRQVGHYGMVVPRFVTQCLKGEDITVYGSGEQTRCFGHVKDVVPAIADLMDCNDATGQIVNIGNPGEVSIMELANKVLAKVGNSTSKIVTVPYDVAYSAGFEDMQRRVPDISKVAALTGYQPSRDLDQILEDVIAEKRESLS